MMYVACKFRSEDSRSYTYEYDGDEPLEVGDAVKVPDRSGDGRKRVEVVSISDDAPPFACKPILGKLEQETESESEREDLLAAGKPVNAIDPLDAEIPW